MSQLIVNNSKEKVGKKIYKNNKFYRNLSNIMENPDFKNMLEENVQDWTDFKVIIMFMFIYFIVSQNKVSPYEKIAMVKEIIDDSDKRQILTQSINNEFNNIKNKLNFSK